MLRITILSFLLLSIVACSESDDNSFGDLNLWDFLVGDNPYLPNPSPTPTPNPGVVVLDTSEENYRQYLDYRSFHVYEYMDTHHFHRFEKESVVVLVQFNESTDHIQGFVYDITPKNGDDIDTWVNYFYSDAIVHHNYDVVRHDIPTESISVDMVMFAGVETGRCGDEYNTYDVRYTIQPHEIIEGLQVPYLSEIVPVWERYQDVTESCSPF